MKAYRVCLYRELGYLILTHRWVPMLAIFAAKKGKIIVNIPVKTNYRTDAPRFGRRCSARKRIMHVLVGALGGSQSPNV
jgi:hypothetical protein